jgi:hypothetical protein
MDIIIFVIVIIGISALGYRYGADSRGLTDHASSRYSLWSR